MIKGDNKIILDAYNANPSSMEVAIENFATQDAVNKLVCLGAMMELGEYSVAEHTKLISKLIEVGLTNVILVGGDFKNIKHPFHFFEDSNKASDWVRKNETHNSLILIKGSRSTQMEKLLTAF
jgi:UDP-N-acetylmuramoyl-tripeptide--D-alanyl-D-alanine ligase